MTIIVARVLGNSTTYILRKYHAKGSKKVKRLITALFALILGLGFSMVMAIPMAVKRA